MKSRYTHRETGNLHALKKVARSTAKPVKSSGSSSADSLSVCVRPLVFDGRFLPLIMDAWSSCRREMRRTGMNAERK